MGRHWAKSEPDRICKASQGERARDILSDGGRRSLGARVEFGTGFPYGFGQIGDRSA